MQSSGARTAALQAFECPQIRPYSDPYATQPILPADIEATANQLPTDWLGIHFLTPVQLTRDGRPLISPQIETIIVRLLEQCQSLEAVYSDHKMPHEVWREQHFTLSATAQNLSIERDDTRWVELWSRSCRTEHIDNIDDLVGAITFIGDVTPFRYWLAYGYGQLIHVGKNAVKGNGWYNILKC